MSFLKFISIYWHELAVHYFILCKGAGWIKSKQFSLRIRPILPTRHKETTNRSINLRYCYIFLNYSSHTIFSYWEESGLPPVNMSTYVSWVTKYKEPIWYCNSCRNKTVRISTTNFTSWIWSFIEGGLRLACLLFNILATSKVMSERVPTCDRSRSWQFRSHAPLGNQATNTMA